MSAIIGIDLGTSNSVVAWEDELGKMNVIADRDDVRIHPSVVSFVEGKLVGGVLAGTAAKPRKILDPRNTVYSFKRLMGQTESSVAVRQLRARVPYEIEAGPDDTPLVRTCSGRFSAVELSAIMLGHVRQLATTHVGRQIKHAVITVPASFNDAQRSATASAGAIAGLEVVRVLNEPTAAALAYGASRRLHEIIAVYDFGGGTFDLTVLKLEDQVYQVLGTAGDSFLGGDDIDDRLVGWMLRKVIDTHRVDLREDLVAMMKLRDAAEQLKIGLSTKPTVSLTLPELAYDKRKRPLAVTFEIARGELEAMIVDLVDRTMSVTRDALAVAQVKAERISDVILVGGTTRIPYVRTGVTTFFAKAVRTDVS
ncbi:MAG TPA: Hsp70 family protein, partial [Kofleriaceae bacterium]|nr:Hsp70 family protein [Kofleriaceae bacterium]